MLLNTAHHSIPKKLRPGAFAKTNSSRAVQGAGMLFVTVLRQ